MSEAMISLLAPDSVSPESIDEWVDEQVYLLRKRWRFTGVQIGELRRSTPAEGGHWFIDLDLRARTVAPEKDVALAAIVFDLEQRGLRPHLLLSARAAQRARSGRSMEETAIG